MYIIVPKKNNYLLILFIILFYILYSLFKKNIDIFEINYSVILIVSLFFFYLLKKITITDDSLTFQSLIIIKRSFKFEIIKCVVLIDPEINGRSPFLSIVKKNNWWHTIYYYGFSRDQLLSLKNELEKRGVLVAYCTKKCNYYKTKRLIKAGKYKFSNGSTV